MGWRGNAARAVGRTETVVKQSDRSLPLSLFLPLSRLKVEYTLVYFDEKQKRAKLSLLGPKILKILQQPEIDSPE